MQVAKMKSLMTKRQWMIALTSLFVIVVIAIGGLFTYEVTKKSVVLSIDGEEIEIKTHADTVNDILVDLDISYRSQDYVSPSLDTKVSDDLQINFKTANQVIVNIDGNKKEAWTVQDTVAEFLEEQDIVLNEHDSLNIPQDSKIENGMEIQLDVAFKMLLNDGGIEKEFWITSTTVADFLAQQGIELNDLDKIEPELEQNLTKDSTVTITRVEKVTDVVEEPIEFAVVTKKDGNLNSGVEKVVQKGQKGKLQRKYEVVLENGEEVSKTLISEEVIEPSQDKVVAVGTKEIPKATSRGVETGKEFYVEATAYTPFCNGCSGVTATGINIKANPDQKVIAVDPNVIPLGTKVYVEGYGYAIAGDTGGSINGHKIDVLFPTKAEAYKWGRKKVKIKILD